MPISFKGISKNREKRSLSVAEVPVFHGFFLRLRSGNDNTTLIGFKNIQEQHRLLV